MIGSPAPDFPLCGSAAPDFSLRGSAAPDFSLRDQNNQGVTLSGYRGSPVLLVFYPFAFTGICQGELTWLRDNLPSAAEVLTISVDSVYAHKVWATQERYEFPLLADFWPHGAVARAYGVFNEKTGAANRGTFLVDRAGIIRYAHMNGPGEPRGEDVWQAALAHA